MYNRDGDRFGNKENVFEVLLAALHLNQVILSSNREMKLDSVTPTGGSKIQQRRRGRGDSFIMA